MVFPTGLHLKVLIRSIDPKQPSRALTLQKLTVDCLHPPIA